VVRRADVKDIAQQVFLKIYKNFDKVPTERVRSWIEVICVQQAADHYRLYRNRFETPEPNVGEDISHGDDVHEQFERCEMEAIVKRVLESMDAPLREVLVRHEFQDESLDSIAKSLGIVRNTAHARLVEAKRIFAIRTKRILGDNRRTLMFLPLFGTDTFRDADLQSSAFVDEMRTQVWRGIAQELGFDENPLISPSTSFPLESQPPSSWRESKRLLRRIVENRGFIAGTGAVAGFIAALLWPRDVPISAQHLSMRAPVINIQNPGSTQLPAKTEPPPAGVVTAAHIVVSPGKAEIDHETRLLENAREFIVKARYSEALAALARHQKDFPDSQYVVVRNRYIALAQEGQKRATSAESKTP